MRDFTKEKKEIVLATYNRIDALEKCFRDTKNYKILQELTKANKQLDIMRQDLKVNENETT